MNGTVVLVGSFRGPVSESITPPLLPLNANIHSQMVVFLRKQHMGAREVVKTNAIKCFASLQSHRAYMLTSYLVVLLSSTHVAVCDLHPSTLNLILCPPSPWQQGRSWGDIRLPSTDRVK
jgi:hypothetical protein